MLGVFVRALRRHGKPNASISTTRLYISRRDPRHRVRKAGYHAGPRAPLRRVGAGEDGALQAAPPSLDTLDEQALWEEFTTRVRRRVRRDTTVPIDGKDYEFDASTSPGAPSRSAAAWST